MVFWSERHFVYKISVLGLYFSIPMYIVGFACPFWSQLEYMDSTNQGESSGLWQKCSYGSNICISNVLSSSRAWMNATRGLCSFTLLLLLCGGCIALYRNVTKRGQALHEPNRRAELMVIVAVFIGIVGVIIYASEYHGNFLDYYSTGRLDWAFVVVCVSLGLSGFCACLMMIFHMPRRPNFRTATYRARGPNGFPVAILVPDMQTERFHIPYFGELSSDELVYGASPVLPPSYDIVTSSAAVPPNSEAPPSYYDVVKSHDKPPEYVQSVSVDPSNKQPSGYRE